MPYEYQCSDVIPDCEWRVTGEQREDTVEEVSRHAEEAHDMAALPDDLTDRMLASIQPTN